MFRKERNAFRRTQRWWFMSDLLVSYKAPEFVPWGPEVFSRVRRDASVSARGRHIFDRRSNRKPLMKSLGTQGEFVEDGKWGKMTISGEKGINKCLLKMGEKKKEEFESTPDSGANFCGKNVFGIFLGGNLFLLIAGKIAKILKIRTHKKFVPYCSQLSERITRAVKSSFMCARVIRSLHHPPGKWGSARSLPIRRI